MGWPQTVALACLLLAGCNWHDFDDVLDKAPVLALGAPDGYLSRDLGKVVLPLTVPSSMASIAVGLAWLSRFVLVIPGGHSRPTTPSCGRLVRSLDWILLIHAESAPACDS